MSISAYVSQGVSREPMIRWLREKEEMKLIEDCSPLELSRLTKVIINGLWAGAISEPAKTVEKIHKDSKKEFRNKKSRATMHQISLDGSEKV